VSDQQPPGSHEILLGNSGRLEKLLQIDLSTLGHEGTSSALWALICDCRRRPARNLYGVYGLLEISKLPLVLPSVSRIPNTNGWLCLNGRRQVPALNAGTVHIRCFDGDVRDG
jgi:hypothetical protein